MKACWACGKELPKESLYYDYENEKGEMKHIFLCNDCLEENNKVVECMSGCFTFVPATSKLRFRNKPICQFCAKQLIKNSRLYCGEDLLDIKYLEKDLKESST